MDAPVVVATHGHCLDGCASAVLFTALHRAVVGADSRFVYFGQTYDPGKNGVDPRAFAGSSDSAILDYRYTAVDTLGWYFDHHRTAFPTPADSDHFAALEARGRGFFDRDAGSCTILIDRVARDRFGVDLTAHAELVAFADMVDRAAFPTAEAAVDRTDPRMKLVSVLEQQGDDRLLGDLVQRLSIRPLGEVARDADLAARAAPLEAAYAAQVARIRAREERRGHVVYVDLLDQPIEVVAKFATYADAPDLPYSVVLTRTDRRCKISIGYNPWCPIARRHDIAAMCSAHGGGGHAVVGAIALPPDPEACRALAATLVEELNR